MHDALGNEPVHVTAEERPHPALQKLARALIALARLRQSETTNSQPTADHPGGEDDRHA